MSSESESVQQNPVTPSTSGKADDQTSQAYPNVSVTTGISTTPPTKCQCQITCKTEKTFFDKFKDGAEIVGILILAVYTCYTVKMYRANQQAADAASSAAQTAHDALVRSNRPWLTDEADPKFTFKILPNDTVAGNLKFPIKNLGPSPALYVGVGAIPWIRHGGDGSDFIQARKEACQWAETNARGMGDTLFPQDIKTYDAGVLKSVPGFGTRVTRFLISGCIAYRDQFDATRSTHHTSFCVVGDTTHPDLLYNCNNGEIAD